MSTRLVPKKKTSHTKICSENLALLIRKQCSSLQPDLISLKMENNNNNDNDFTFCQVGPPINQNGFATEKPMPDISSITIKDTVPVKQEKIGSLSFNVIDTTPMKLPIGPPEAAAVAAAAAESSVKGLTMQKGAPKKPAARAKVPFEKGYSQMDWLKLTRTHPDLAGLKGQSSRRLISMSEVKQHISEASMWTVLKGRVYNISPYMKFHPGGADMLMKAVGKDCTSLFNKYHAWVNAEFLLEKCLVGILDENH
ncbi:hypothetical protein Nepgr_020844 [Nepenthes gracilis]|uniref:Cytochrome b5 heme-binding domain-containing protein n=1 Tax=Nepenthes gracilis TaxID=150966 RepID=A0AAD3XVL1_NEPGR|nr:hypothetical protein Nepgr_020844 [Nepenthes gracilis]